MKDESLPKIGRFGCDSWPVCCEMKLYLKVPLRAFFTMRWNCLRLLDEVVDTLRGPGLVICDRLF